MFELKEDFLYEYHWLVSLLTNDHLIKQVFHQELNSKKKRKDF
jgi:hypothetical protein